MRRLLFAGVILLIASSCFTPQKLGDWNKPTELSSIAEVKNFYPIDFTKYTEKGFLITPEKYLGEYESIGIVRYEAYPGAIYKTISSIPNPAFLIDKNEPSTLQTKEWIVGKISLQDALDGIYLKCKQMGADALVNFDIKYDAVPYTGITNPIHINGYIVTGFAIKRK